LLAVHVYHFNAVLTTRSHHSAKVSWWRSAGLLLEPLQISLECRSVYSHFARRWEFDGTRTGRWPEDRWAWAIKGRSSAIQPKLILGAADGNEGD